MLDIFNVTDPQRIRACGSLFTGNRGSYNFVQSVNDGSEIISFRDGSGVAILDLRKAKTPLLVAVEQGVSAPAEMLGMAGFLAPVSQEVPAHRIAKNIAIVEAGAVPHVLTTVTGVTRQVTNQTTGTTFLLGDHGIMVVRRLDVERMLAFSAKT